VAEGVTKNRILAAFGLLLLAIVTYAWFDGGREPLHTIIQPVALPGAGR